MYKRQDIDRESQRFFRHAIPESVNMLIDERRRAFPTITKLGSDMSVPEDRLADVIALYRRSLAEAGLESADVYKRQHQHTCSATHVV